jgi:hypothetical protein
MYLYFVWLNLLVYNQITSCISDFYSDPNLMVINPCDDSDHEIRMCMKLIMRIICCITNWKLILH